MYPGIQTYNSRTSNRRGFTLVEILVVMAIISLLAAIVLASFSIIRMRGRDGRRLADLKQVQNALELYANNNGGTYPNVTTPTPIDVALVALVPSAIVVTPSDPRQGSLVYLYISNKSAGSTGYCLGAVIEGTPPSPASSCAPAIDLIGYDDYSGGPKINYAIGIN